MLKTATKKSSENNPKGPICSKRFAKIINTLILKRMKNILKSTALMFTAFVAAVSVATVGLGNTNVLAQSCVNGDGVNCGGSGGGGNPPGTGSGCTNLLSVTSNATSFNEGNQGVTPVTLTVIRSNCDPSRTNSVVWTVQGTGNNPTNDNDFNGEKSGTVQFNSGQSSKTATLNINGDVTPEPNETFKVCLSQLSGDAALIDSFANSGCTSTITVLNDDSTAPGGPDPVATYVAPESLPCTDPVQNLWNLIGTVLCAAVAVTIDTVIAAPAFALIAIPSAVVTGVCLGLNLSCSGVQQFTNNVTNAISSVLAWTGEIFGVVLNARPFSPPPANPPTVDISAQPLSVNYNGSSTLSWTSSNADWCTASGAWLGTKAKSGSETVSSLTSAREYKLTCKNEAGMVADAVTVNVVLPPAPTLTVSASPTKVSVGFFSPGSTTISWSSNNADTCYRSWVLGGLLQGPTSGSEKVGGDLFGIWGPSNFTVTCNGKGGSVTKTVNVST